MVSLRVVKKFVSGCLSLFMVICLTPAQAASSGSYSMGPSFSGVDLSKGLYSGVELGKAQTDTTIHAADLPGHDAEPDRHKVLSGKIDNEPEYARLFFGWLFHVNLALEIGILHLNEMKLEKLLYANDSNDNEHKAKIDVAAIDATLKLILPVSDQVRFFTRGGLAYERVSSDDKITIDDDALEEPEVLEVLKGGDDRYTWLLAVGVTFAVTNALELLFSWTHYARSGQIPQTETVGLGVIYHTV